MRLLIALLLAALCSCVRAASLPVHPPVALSAVRIASVTRQPSDDAGSLTVHWTSSIAAELDPSADIGEPLRIQHSVFAEWTDPNDASRRTVRACGSAAPGTHCDIPSGVLPRSAAVAVSLRVVSECRLSAEQMNRGLECMSAMSPPWSLDRGSSAIGAAEAMPAHRSRRRAARSSRLQSAPSRSIPAPKPTSLRSPNMPNPPTCESWPLPGPEPNPGVSGASSSVVPPPPLLLTAADAHMRLVDEDAVREALCAFYDLTQGYFSNDDPSGWYKHDGWCSDAPYCSWLGVHCEPRPGSNNNTPEQVVTRLCLQGNMIMLNTSTAMAGGNINALWPALPALRALNIGANGELGQLNLTALPQLEALFLPEWFGPSFSSYPPALTRTWNELVLPEDSGLQFIDLSQSGMFFNTMSTPQLQSMILGQNTGEFILSDIACLPRLQIFLADTADLNDTSLRRPPGDLCVGGCVNGILENMAKTNPELVFLDLSSTQLDFGSGTESYGNFPAVIDAPLLRTLNLNYLARLRSGTEGPNPSWASLMPRLEILGLQMLPDVVLDSAHFLRASTAIQQFSAFGTVIQGDLSPMERWTNLTLLNLDDTGITSELPRDVASVWPRLEDLRILRCNIHGPMPSFAHLPGLRSLRLANNFIRGSLPPDAFNGSIALAQIELNSNRITGSIPAWDLPGLYELNFAGLRLSGELPPSFWDSMPRVVAVDLSYSSLSGSIPNASSPTMLQMFAIPGNKFWGGLPMNVHAGTYLAQGNLLSGSLSPMYLRGWSEFMATEINLSNNVGFVCPIDLRRWNHLSSLLLSNAGFSGCDFTDPAHVSLPGQALKTVDISHNAWAPMVLPVEPWWEVVSAANASVWNVSVQTRPGWDDSFLASLVLDDNPIIPDPVQQVSMVAALNLEALEQFSCIRCGLSMSAKRLVSILGQPDAPLVFLDLSGNDLWGALPPAAFSWSVEQQTVADPSSGWPTFPQGLTFLSFRDNTRLTGPLPLTGEGAFPSLNFLDFSNTSLSGPVPASWGAFSALRELYLHATNVSCELSQGLSTGRIGCDLPPWLAVQPTMTQIPVDNTPGAALVPGFHCPLLGVPGNNRGSVEIDASYYAFTKCVCDAGYFGIDGRCEPCPSACTCPGGAVIQGCYPVFVLGQAVRSRRAVPRDDSVRIDSFTPFSRPLLLPCPRTLTGGTLCNGNSSLAWQRFYQPAHAAGKQSAAVTLSHEAPLSGEPAASWCFVGHTGRLCAQCADGFFSSGRWCLRCLGQGAHVVILVCNLAVLAALITHLFIQQPPVAKALAEMRSYLAEERTVPRKPLRAPSPHASSSSSQHSLAQPLLEIQSVSPGESSSDGDVALDIQQLPPWNSAAASVPSNPLRILVFHSQQLSLLLITSASIPSALAGLLSVVSSGSSGFSLSSLTAMECLAQQWSTAHRCWAAVLAPVLIGAVALITFLSSWTRRSQASNPFKEKEFAPPVDVAAKVAATAAAAAQVSRVYSVCISLLYFIFFPCAQTALSALGCTDRREVDLQAAGGDSDSRTYLNLLPWQRCDAQWRADIMPPALIAAVWWCVLFPIASTIMLYRAHRTLSSTAALRAVSSNSPAVAGPTTDSATVRVWLLSCDLLKPFHPRCYLWSAQAGLATRTLGPESERQRAAAVWPAVLTVSAACCSVCASVTSAVYREQVLLVRRLLLAACVSLVPSDSLYLPLLLLALVQASALLQHWAQPFRAAWLNRAELASLYLLLLNYTSSLVEQAAAVADESDSDAAWITALFAVNLLFILTLLAGLFAVVRQAGVRHTADFSSWLSCCFVRGEADARSRSHSPVGRPASSSSLQQETVSGEGVFHSQHESKASL